MRKSSSHRGNEKSRTSPVQELAMRLSREEATRCEPPHRFLVAALLSFAVLVLSLASSGCTVGQTRFALGATLVADAATTQSALGSGQAAEGNPVLKNAPIPIMLVLSGVVALVAEKHVRNGETRKARTLYTVASVVHGVAAAWNGYQMGKIGGAGASTARPATLAAFPGPRTGAGGNGAFRVRF